MYICSFLLFVSASSILFFGIKQCVCPSEENVKKYNTYKNTQNIVRDYSNDFQEHNYLLQDTNDELLDAVYIKRKVY